MSKKAKRRILLAVTDEQLRCIINALEEHFRLRMGQTYIELVDDLCFQNIVPEGEDGKMSDRQFNDCIIRRDEAREKLQEFMDICFNRDWRRQQKTEEVINEIDLWRMIRHWRWSQRDHEERGYGVESYPVYQFGSEPLPEIKWEE